ncbi:MAG TPA: tRNA threonylcarbamoyladenosine dehydratase, partial [bacterium]|nr:tRNA threonylcarbamoyladenosine dehydratase [bacterium]
MTFTERTDLVFGADGLEKLKNSTVAVYGLGGVGA